MTAASTILIFNLNIVCLNTDNIANKEMKMHTKMPRSKGYDNQIITTSIWVQKYKNGSFNQR